MKRRTMLLAASAGVALTVPRVAAAAFDSEALRMAVIYDERHADARAFAEYLRGRGVDPMPTRGDATSLWYGSPRQQPGGAIAGLTTWSDVVIARSYGREMGLRLAFDSRDLAIPASVSLLARECSRLRVSLPGLTVPSREARADPDRRVKPCHHVSVVHDVDNGSAAAEQRGDLVLWLLLPRVIKPL